MESVIVENVVVGKRHREVNATQVIALAESMSAIGLQQPISVWLDDDDMPHLVAGLHRLKAAEKLGWEEIPAIFVDMGPVEREMWEIAENLFRVDLSKEQRDEHIRRYAELLKAREAEVVPQSASKPKSGPQGGRPKSIARKIADETGLSDDTVRRALNPTPKLIEPRVVMTDDDAETQQFNALVSSWNRAGRNARQRFREFIDEPVFDSSRMGAA